MKRIILILATLLLTTATAYAQCGVASWYGGKDGLNGKQTASGEIFNTNELTAAHRSLPFGTKLKVTLQKNGKTVIVRINDRGPFAHNRIIDLSKAAARKLGITNVGIGKVCIERIK